MSFNLSDYVHQLKTLLPVGVLWESLKLDETVDNYLNAEAAEYAIIDARIENLLNETDPRKTYELLVEWEEFAGLPDDCAGESATLEQRRIALHARLTSTGGASKAYFIELAANLGYTVTITEFYPHSVASPVNYAMYGENWRYVWQINALEQGEDIRYFKVNSGVNEPLAVRNTNILECVINKLKPGHTLILFNYGEQ
ncbi:DUF2313 domain-containing protein [Pseudomonadota bacterium]|nr:DUF2313 domain-containing protein [Pseudomonadota bacterium]